MKTVQIATHYIYSDDETMHESMFKTDERYCKMHEQLGKTHKITQGIPYVWERWELLTDDERKERGLDDETSNSNESDKENSNQEIKKIDRTTPVHPGNEICWMPGYTFEKCCASEHGGKGNEMCWDAPGFDFDFCCFPSNCIINTSGSLECEGD